MFHVPKYFITAPCKASPAPGMYYACRMRHRPQTVQVVHGEAEAKLALAVRLREVIPGLPVEIPSCYTSMGRR